MTTISTPNPTGVSRFHAIVAAKPGLAAGVAVLPQQPFQTTTAYDSWSVTFDHTKGKQKQDMSEPGPSNLPAKRTLKRTMEEEGHTGKEPTTLYSDREALLSALATRFKLGPHVDFHGMYRMSESNSGVTHKQRIQTVTHEIWKTTGYRFTVKDHPAMINGHKTRFWCSQDEAHRSKSSRAARKAQGSFYKPRVTSAGEVMAKARYPCKSRLLVSSRDSDGMRAITVRMHHHVAHEPYVDANLPPEVVQGIWESFGWLSHTGVPPVPPNLTATSSTHEASTEPGSLSLQEDDEGDGSSGEEGTASPPDSPSHDVDAGGSTNESMVPPLPALPSAAESDLFEHRMVAHIKNLREFCDGLEYQLQFKDFRMLQVLEREGGPFLNLVAECLKKEGRLVPVNPPAVTAPPAPSTSESRSKGKTATAGMDLNLLDH